MWLPLQHPLLGTWPTTHTCALTGNRTGHTLVYRLVFHLLSHTSQGYAHFLIGLFVFLEWSYLSSVYILEMKPLSEVSLTNMFYYTVCSCLILMLFSLAMQKLFTLMRPNLFILSFMSLALGDMLVKILLHVVSEIFLSMFSSSTFILS